MMIDRSEINKKYLDKDLPIFVVIGGRVERGFLKLARITGESGEYPIMYLLPKFSGVMSNIIRIFSTDNMFFFETKEEALLFLIERVKEQCGRIDE